MDRPDTMRPNVRTGPRESPSDRNARIERIRAQIEAGSYENDAKIDLALGRLLDELKH